MPLALAACGLLGCRSAAPSGSADAPPSIDVGAGSPDAVARRSARELADSSILARRAPRAGDGDQRYAVRIDPHEFATPSSVPSFASMLQTALVATGSFLIVEDAVAPAIHARVTENSAEAEALVWVSDADGEPWLHVHGRLVHPN